MESFMKASEEVEESILFPSIAWPSCDDDDGDDDDTEKCSTSGFDNKVLSDDEPKAKRQCRGLIRLKNSLDLSSLVGTSLRRGSNGSMC
jgi:hypothetical protein